MTSVSEAYKVVQEDVGNIAKACCRDPKEITLIAVSKGHSWEQIKPAYDAGCRNFGESRVQEGLEKIAQAPDDIQWHMIGSLQKNKINKALGKFALIHSVDTPELAIQLSRHSEAANLVTPILLEVNTSGEPTKHGLSIEQWRPAFENLLPLLGVQIQGLMTIAPLVEDEKLIRSCFTELRLFREELQQKAGSKANLSHLSMGMSHDYRFAIAEGATLLRIGTSIFGSR